LWPFPIACYHVALFLFENSNLPKFLPQMRDYSYCTFKNGHLHTKGLHRHDFPLLLWDALVQTSYGDKGPEYYSRLCEEHDLQLYEVYVDIPSHPVFVDGSTWSTWDIGLTWIMLWRRLLTWHSPPCARKNWLLLLARPSRYILSRTALT
jgi:hypothetical protein